MSSVSIAETLEEKLEYRTCLKCVRHPRYPDTPATTLHRGGKCEICGNES